MFHCSRICGGVYVYTHIKWLIEISPNQKANMPVNTETVKTIKNNIQIHIN
nr:MAG TPA: hypothetical protein [Caudoviricetes sp.]